MFVTFEQPGSLRDALAQKKEMRLGPDHRLYSIQPMNINRLSQYQPPCAIHELQNFAASIELTSGELSRSSIPSTIAISSPSSASVSTAIPPVLPASTGNAETNPHKKIPTAPQAMIKRSLISTPPRGPRSDSSNYSRRDLSLNVHHTSRPPEAKSSEPEDLSILGDLRTQLASAQKGIEAAEARLNKCPEKRSSAPTNGNQNLITSLESRAADERSKRKSLEREYDRLMRDLDEVDRVYEREIERKDSAEAELRRVMRQARWQPTSTVTDSSKVAHPKDMDVSSEDGSKEVHQAQKETDSLRETLAELDRELALENQTCARLIQQRDRLRQKPLPLPFPSQKDLPASHASIAQPATPLTPAMLSAMTTLDTIARSIVQKLSSPNPDALLTGSETVRTHADESKGLKRRHSVSLD